MFSVCKTRSDSVSHDMPSIVKSGGGEYIQHFSAEVLCYAHTCEPTTPNTRRPFCREGGCNSSGNFLSAPRRSCAASATFESAATVCTVRLPLLQPALDVSTPVGLLLLAGVVLMLLAEWLGNISWWHAGQGARRIVGSLHSCSLSFVSSQHLVNTVLLVGSQPSHWQVTANRERSIQNVVHHYFHCRKQASYS